MRRFGNVAFAKKKGDGFLKGKGEDELIARIGEWEIRSFADTDIEPISVYANNRKVSINLTDMFPFPYSTADAEKWIRHVRDGKIELNFAIASKKEPIGGIGFRMLDDIHRLTAEIGYWIGEPFWGKGIVTMAIREMTQYAFDNFGIVRIQAGVFDRNPASARALEKAGYEFEGRMRKAVIKENTVLDMLMYATVKTSEE